MVAGANPNIVTWLLCRSLAKITKTTKTNLVERAIVVLVQSTNIANMMWWRGKKDDNDAEDTIGDAHDIKPPNTQSSSDASNGKPAKTGVATAKDSDLIALDSALQLLEAQLVQAQLDIQRLREIKEKALDSPVAFAHSLQRNKKPNPTASGVTKPATTKKKPTAKRAAIDSTNTAGRSPAVFENFSNNDLPQPQQIVKCPRINWASYSKDESFLERARQFDSAIERGNITDSPLRPLAIFPDRTWLWSFFG